MDLVLANLYANKCKKKVDDILPILKEGRWLTAQEALEYGFIDEIVEDGSKLNFDDAIEDPLQHVSSSGFACDGGQDRKSGSRNSPSWFNNFVNKFFKGHQPDTPQAQNKPLNHSTTQMKKDYQKSIPILKIEGVEVDKMVR